MTEFESKTAALCAAVRGFMPQAFGADRGALRGASLEVRDRLEAVEALLPAAHTGWVVHGPVTPPGACAGLAAAVAAAYAAAGGADVAAFVAAADAVAAALGDENDDDVVYYPDAGDTAYRVYRLESGWCAFVTTRSSIAANVRAATVRLCGRVSLGAALLAVRAHAAAQAAPPPAAPAVADTCRLTYPAGRPTHVRGGRPPEVVTKALVGAVTGTPSGYDAAYVAGSVEPGFNCVYVPAWGEQQFQLILRYDEGVDVYAYPKGVDPATSGRVTWLTKAGRSRWANVVEFLRGPDATARP